MAADISLKEMQLQAIPYSLFPKFPRHCSPAYASPTATRTRSITSTATDRARPAPAASTSSR